MRLGGGCMGGCPLLPGPERGAMGWCPARGGGPEGSIFLRSSLRGSSFLEARSLFLSRACGGLSRCGGGGAAPRSLRGGCPGVGERELADDTGLARSAYMSSESALRTELLLDDADDTDDTLLTLRDLDFLDFLDPERERDMELEEDLDLELEPL